MLLLRMVRRRTLTRSEAFDKERGLLGVLLGLRILFKEGNGGVVGGKIK